LDEWRKRAITEAGKSFGFRRLIPGEVLPVVLVPPLTGPNKRYFVILRGTLDGYDAAFFDLFLRGRGRLVLSIHNNR
jgi:hypothetical protein